MIAILLNDALAIKIRIDRHEISTACCTRDTLSNGPIRRSVGLSVRDRRGPKDGPFFDFYKTLSAPFITNFQSTRAYRKHSPIASKTLLRIPLANRYPTVQSACQCVRLFAIGKAPKLAYFLSKFAGLRFPRSLSASLPMKGPSDRHEILGH